MGAIEYWDANVDDARYVVAVLRTAKEHGAIEASRTQVVELTRDAGGTVIGAVLEVLDTGELIPVRARAVIQARPACGPKNRRRSQERRVACEFWPPRGIHIVVPRERIKGEVGLILQTPTSVLFVIPWSRYWVIGTTDTPWSQDFTHPGDICRHRLCDRPSQRCSRAPYRSHGCRGYVGRSAPVVAAGHDPRALHQPRSRASTLSLRLPLD